jgi:hypothetical protein
VVAVGAAGIDVHSIAIGGKRRRGVAAEPQRLAEMMVDVGAAGRHRGGPAQIRQRVLGLLLLERYDAGQVERIRIVRVRGENTCITGRCLVEPARLVEP